MRAIYQLVSVLGSPAWVTVVQALSTLGVPLPTGGTPFTSTVLGCGTVAPFVIVGFPNGTFVPGTQTVFLPPQASPTLSSFINTEFNLTQFVVATPLPGSCAPLDLPADVTATEIGASPSGTVASNSSVCPPTALTGCPKAVNDAAQMVILVLNEITEASQRLQVAARHLGRRSRGGMGGGAGSQASDSSRLETRFDPISDLVEPLKDITEAITLSLPLLTALPAFVVAGCDADSTTVALMDFVQVHRALLKILIGRAGLLSTGGGRAELEEGENTADFGINPVRPVVAAALRAIKTCVDGLAYDLIGLLPTRQACLKLQQKSLDATLKEAIAAYE